VSASRLAAALLALGLLAGCAPALPESPGLGGSDADTLDSAARTYSTTDAMPPPNWPDYLPFPELPKGHTVELLDCMDPSSRYGAEDCTYWVRDLTAKEIRSIEDGYRARLQAAGWEWAKWWELWQRPDDVPQRYIGFKQSGSTAMVFTVTDWR